MRAARKKVEKMPSVKLWHELPWHQIREVLDPHLKRRFAFEIAEYNEQINCGSEAAVADFRQ